MRELQQKCINVYCKAETVLWQIVDTVFVAYEKLIEDIIVTIMLAVLQS